MDIANTKIMTRKRRREEEAKQISKQSSQESPGTSRHKSSAAAVDAQASGKTKKRKDAEPKPVNSNWMQLQAVCVTYDPLLLILLLHVRDMSSETKSILRIISNFDTQVFTYSDDA